MQKVQIWVDDGNWYYRCAAHNEYYTCDSWADVYEAAMGHACMKHKKSRHCQRCEHPYGPDFIEPPHTFDGDCRFKVTPRGSRVIGDKPFGLYG